MALSRYRFSKKIRNGKYYGTSNVNSIIHRSVKNGILDTTTTILAENQRLDHLAMAAYGDSNLWWVIAAASGIGWGLQVPPGTLIFIPSNINQVYNLI